MINAIALRIAVITDYSLNEVYEIIHSVYLHMHVSVSLHGAALRKPYSISYTIYIHCQLTL